MPSRRFSLATLLLAVLAICLGLSVYVLTASFEVQALVHVSHSTQVPIGRNYDYRRAQSLVAEQFESNAVIEEALNKVGNQRLTVADLQERLDVHVVEYSEFLSISLRGQRFRDNKAALVRLLNTILEGGSSARVDAVTQIKVIQPAVVR